MGYARIKDFRRRTKERMVAAMGGKCQCCGYSACVVALDFHHIENKEFTLAQWSRLKWEVIATELRKCVLLCANCHRELHAGFRTLPTERGGFNEDFAVLCKENTSETRKCQQCGSDYICSARSGQRFCGYDCVNLHKRKIDWDSIDLIAELATKPMNQVARELNISFSAVKKRLVKQRAAIAQLAEQSSDIR